MQELKEEDVGTDRGILPARVNFLKVATAIT